MGIYKLSNGLRVITEVLPHFQSISVGVWVGAGCYAESVKNNGISHFIEHMLFKGTKKRSAKEIAGCIDSLGGQLNAFTAKECTCFYVNILSEHFGTAVDLLCDMITQPSLDNADISREKGVVCEEIAMVADTPDDVAADLLYECYYGTHPLGKTILGTNETVNAITRADIQEYMGKMYIPENTVISVSGGFDEKAILDMLEEKIGQAVFPETKKPVFRSEKIDRPESKIKLVNKDIEQINLCLGFPCEGNTSKEYFAQSMIANILGGSMSSRLFQRVREQNGMTYSIYSYLASAVNSGIFALYAGMNPSQAETVFCLMADECRKLVEKGISEKELFEAKQQLKGSFVLGLENAASRMSRNGKVLLLNGKVLSQREVLDSIDAVTNDDISRNINSIFSCKMSAAAVGNCTQCSNLEKLIKENQQLF